MRQWRHPLVVPLYLAFGLATGSLWLDALARAFGSDAAYLPILVLLATGFAWALKLQYWQAIDAGAAASTPETATGLGDIGTVRMLAPPHTEDTYLLREMGSRVARKHAGKLRRIAVVLGLALPVLLTAPALFVPGPYVVALTTAAALSGMAGVLIERWLFFAEATHTVMLYYGERAA